MAARNKCEFTFIISIPVIFKFNFDRHNSAELNRKSYI